MNCWFRLPYLTAIVCLAVVATGSKAAAAEQSGVIAAKQESIVKLFGAGVGTLDSYGSGVLVSGEGHVVTVWNHLVNTGFLTAVVADGRRFNVTVVGTSLDHDLAVLKLNCDEEDEFNFVDLTNQPEATLGQSVLAFSNVFHVATGNEPVSVVHGVIACEAVVDAGLGRWQFPVKSPVYVLDAITNNSGAAGGLLTDVSGQPLGLLGREIRHRETDMWVNYAVPWKTLQPAIRAIITGQKIKSTNSTADRPGLSERRLTAAYGLTLMPGVLKRTPAYIDRIVPDSIAAKAGLQRGDLVVLVNDDIVQSVEDVQRLLAGFRRGKKISITVNRQDSLQTLSLRTPR